MDKPKDAILPPKPTDDAWNVLIKLWFPNSSGYATQEYNIDMHKPKDAILPPKPTDDLWNVLIKIVIPPEELKVTQHRNMQWYGQKPADKMCI